MLVPLRQMLYPHYVGGTVEIYKNHPWLFKTEEEVEAKPVIEAIAEKVIETPFIETEQDIELILRLRLEQEGLIYKVIYLKWIKACIERQKRNKAIILLLLH